MNELATDSVGIKARIDLYKFNHRVDHELYDLLSDTKRLIDEKDRLIHSLAHDLIEASKDLEYWIQDKTYCHTEGYKQVDRYEAKAKDALNSVTDKGEKNE